MNTENEIILNEETVENEIKESAGFVVDKPTVVELSTTVNWKQKLSSRKLWAALLTAVFALLTALFGEELPVEMVTVIRTGIYGLIAYIFGEGAVDMARVIAGNGSRLPASEDKIESNEKSGDY